MGLEYRAAAREAADQPVVFYLGREKFSTHVEVDGMALMEFMKAGVEEADDDLDIETLRAKAAAGDEVATQALGLATARQVTVFYDFLQAALPAGDFRHLRKVCSRHHVPLPTVMQIARDVISQLLGRPTPPSADSVALPSSNGVSSTGGDTSQEPADSSG